MNDKKLENLLLKSFELLDRVKETCKVTVSQCLQIPSEANAMIRSCLETIDTSDLCKMFIINRSPNIKNCIAFTLKVIKTNINECDKLKDDENCKEMVKFCHTILEDTYKVLQQLQAAI